MYLFIHGTFSSIKMFKQDIKKYFDRLQIKLGETHSADKILEGPWLEGVVRELNLMSYHCVRELQLETRQPYSKYFSDGTKAYDLPYEGSTDIIQKLC
jgi:hypothetical protein